MPMPSLDNRVERSTDWEARSLLPETDRPTSATPLGRISTVVDGTGVGRAFTDIIHEAGVAFNPVGTPRHCLACGAALRGSSGWRVVLIDGPVAVG
jgi:hypothetical protein